jgi:hypothetical protein
MAPVRRLAVLLGLSLLVSGAQGTGSPVHPSAGLPWSGTAVLRRFDPARGELRGVRLVLESFARADVRVENTASTGSAATGVAQVDVGVRLPDGTAVAVNHHSAQVSFLLAAFDGTLDYSGRSSAARTLSGRLRQEVLIQDPSQLLAFVGRPGAPGAVELPLFAVGATSLQGGPDLASESLLQAGARVRAIFFYEPGP